MNQPVVLDASAAACRHKAISDPMVLTKFGDAGPGIVDVEIVEDQSHREITAALELGKQPLILSVSATHASLQKKEGRARATAKQGERVNCTEQRENGRIATSKRLT